MTTERQEGKGKKWSSRRFMDRLQRKLSDCINLARKSFKGLAFKKKRIYRKVSERG